MKPPIAGPMSRAPLTIEELMAMALARSPRSSTIWTRKDWRPGMSKALIRPWNTMRAMISPRVITLASVKAASARDWIAAATWVTTSSRRRSRRSTHTAAKGPRRKETI